MINLDRSQKIAHGIRAHRDDEKSSLLYSAAKIRLDGNCILPFELPQLPWIAVVHDDRLIVVRKPQSRDKCAGDASSAEKDGRFHASFLQTWSAASTSAATSAFLCAVEMIQCSPFEGVI